MLQTLLGLRVAVVRVVSSGCNGSQSLDLTLDLVDVSNAGIYSCEAILADSVGEIANISRNHTLFVQSKLKL